jgi:mevalonate kinase
MKQTFYSNGKLLLTGEYLVLDGAKALALPTKFGQDLVVEKGVGKQIQWKSYDNDGSVWFEDTISFEEIISRKTEGSSIKSTLIEILHAAFRQDPNFITPSEGFNVTTHLTFPKFWGLGTSSTLINNIAQWLRINAYELLQDSIGGSGYDIAAAQHNAPIIYQLENNIPKVEEVDFNPSFKNNIHFVYLNRKQSSKAAISSYYNNRVEHLAKKIEAINQITSIVAATDNPGVFARAIENHESILSDILEMETVRETFFKDFKGEVKSLGGWGGDFILAISKDDPSEYFKSKGFNTIIPYREMILETKNPS